MKFSIKKAGLNLLNLARRAGYIPQKTTEAGEQAFIRPIQRDFPRFHLYIKESNEDFILNLHLDQKKPSYGRETAHSGDYDGELVRDEALRIQSLLRKAPEKKEATAEEPKEKTSKLSALFRKMLGGE